MSMTQTAATTASALVKMLRFGMIAIAAVLLAGSIATSLSRPAATNLQQSTQPDDDAALPAMQAPNPGVTVWHGANGRWVAGDSAVANTPGDGVVPLLLRFEGLESGRTYSVGIRYGTCSASGPAGFSGLGTAPPLSSAMINQYPGAGRQRPDATIAVPPEHGPTDARISMWGGTFALAAERFFATGACAADAIVELPVRAQSDHLVLTFGGQAGTGFTGSRPLPTVTGFISPMP